MKPTFEERLAILEQACFGNGIERLQAAEAEGTRVTQECMKAVCERAELPLPSMRWKGKTKTLANWRQCAMFLAFELSGLSSGKIAMLFNRKDHNTVLHAHRVAPKKFPRKLLNELRERVMLQQNAA